MSDTRRVYTMLDSSVLLLFLAIDRMDLLASHPECSFVITEHVRGEVMRHYGELTDCLDAALNSGAITESRLDRMAELALFSQLSENPRLGLGECAAIAAAITRSQPLAIDDGAARKAALDQCSTLQILDRRNILFTLVRSGKLTLTEADAISDARAGDYMLNLTSVNAMSRLAS